MGRLGLSDLQEQHYYEIKNKFNEANNILLSVSETIKYKEILDMLSEMEYIVSITYDSGMLYVVQGDFNDFEEWLIDRAKEEKRLSRREWKIALVGAFIGLIPFIVTTIIPWIIKLFAE